MSYLRSNYRTHVGFIVLPYKSDSTAGYLTNISPATGLMVISANACDLLIYAGNKFMRFSAAVSTGA